MTGILFDVFSLQGNGVYTIKTDVYSAPPITIQDEKLAQADGSVIVKKQLAPKVFTCDGYMQMDTTANLDLLLDTFKRALNKQEQNFDIDYAGSTRRYTATPRNMIISREKGLNTCTWSVEFLCANPVGADISSSTLLSPTTISTSSSTAGITVNGSYKAEPKITITITAVTGGTGGKTVTISNASTLRGVAITRDWTAGDVLEIDSLKKTLFINNSVIDFTGQFPMWDPGNSGISYLDNFTTRTVSMTASYYVRYL